MTSSLPPDLIQQLGRRVAIAALVFAASWLVIHLLTQFTAEGLREAGMNLGAWMELGPRFTVLAVGISLLAAMVAWRLSGRPGWVLSLAMVYEVLMGAMVAFPNQWHPGPIMTTASWVGVGIIIFPAIVPAPLSIMIAASCATAATEPLIRLVAVLQGVSPRSSGVEWFWLVAPNFMCVGLAIIPVMLVRRLGRAVTEAREIGNYRLGSVVGRGGMGVVYAASHRLLARHAAIKVINAEQFGAQDAEARAVLAERFWREAGAAAMLRSPHTIELYDFGTSADGTLYYAMELLEGITLQHLVERHGPQPPGRVIHLLRQACRSLAEAHQKGMVHRDIKPSNLMICRMGTEVDFLKVLDFGLVKPTVAPDRPFTAPDVTAGTPAFMAPEAMEGAHGLDHRADLYALGCVAYWLLCGRPVFDGPTALAILVKHGCEAPLPIGLDSVGADLQALVMQCLEKLPGRRPEDALELERALARCVQASSWTAELSEQWWTAHVPAAQARPAA